MKKYLITGALALAAAVVMTGCHENEDFSGSTLDAKAKAYEETFIEAFGQPNPKHNWGFGTLGNARTRTDVLKPDMWDDTQERIETIQANAPDPITDGERSYVANWFHNNTGFTDGLDINNFYLQHVTATIAVRNGLFHNYEQNNNPSSWTEDISAEAYLDKLEVGSEQNLSHTEHIFDFNRDGIGDWETVYVQDGSALQFGVHSSWGKDSDSPNGDGYYWYFKCAEITVPGENFDDGQDKTAWYVGICYYGRAYETTDANGNPEKWRELGNENVAAERCEDWILKVVPGVGETITPPNGGNEKPKVNVMRRIFNETVITEIKKDSFETEQLLEQGRVFCEDLGSVGRTDIDFNDLVFDAKIWQKTKYRKTITNVTTKEGDVQKSFTTDTTIVIPTTYNDTIMVLAGGGTLPLTFGTWGDLKTNVFKTDSYLRMINTVTDADTARLIKGVQYGTADPATLYSHDYRSINSIPIWVEFAKETKKLNRETGQEETVTNDYVMDETETGYVPRCILVPLGTPWATERTPIDEAYAYFTDYVKDMRDCWSQAAPAAVYPEIGGLEPSPEAAFTVRRFNEGSSTTTHTDEGGAEYNTDLEIEVDQVVPEPYGTSILEGGGTLLTQYYETERIGGSNANDAIYISPSKFRDMHPGDVIRIYGIGADSDGYLWRIYTGTASNNVGGGDGTQYSYNNQEGREFLASHGYIEVQIYDVASLQSTGWYIAGTNFYLSDVTIVAEGDTGEEEDTTKEGQIWPESGSDSQTSIWIGSDQTTTLFADATTDNKVCIYCTQGSWFQLYLGWVNLGENNISATGWTVNGQVMGPNSYNSEKGCVELPLNDALLNGIKTWGLGIQGDYTITNITIE